VTPPATAPSIVPLAVPAGPAVLRLLPALARALDGTGPAVAPHAEGADDLPAAAALAGPPARSQTEPHPAAALTETAATAGADLPAGLALVVGTSGSTGRPKRALLTAAALRASATGTHERLGGPGQWLLAMPAHHVAGLQVLIRSLLAGTIPVVVDARDGFTTEAFVAATARLDPGSARHYTAAVPTQLSRLLADERGREALRRYDGVLVGGAATPGALLHQAESAGVRVLTTYGMSETAGGCFYGGIALTGARVRFAPDGRVSLGGPMVCHGYLGEPALSAAALSTDADGTRWFRTDDLGRLDGEGLLRIEGRIDDVINTGGLKVSPHLVEDALLEHVPGVLEAVVVGTAHPEWGEAVSAAVVLAPGSDGLTVAAVRDRLRGILPDHALPQRLARMDAIPLRGPGKPDRVRVRAAAGWQDWGR
jgi:o-succinylbenzoate---CoA ligase